MDVTLRKILLDSVYDLPKKRSMLEHDIEYVLVDEFFTILVDKIGLELTTEEQNSLI